LFASFERPPDRHFILTTAETEARKLEADPHPVLFFSRNGGENSPVHAVHQSPPCSA